MTCHDCQERIIGNGYPIYRSQAKRCDRCHEDDLRRSMRGENHKPVQDSWARKPKHRSLAT